MTYPSDPASSTNPADSPPTYSSPETTTLYPPPPETASPIATSSAYDDSSTFDTSSVAGQSTTGVANQQASKVGDSTVKAGQQVAAKAKDEAANVAAEAKSQAKKMFHQTRDEVTSQAGAQQQRLAEGLRSLSSELQSMTQNSDQDGPAAQVARQAADRLGSAASWLENRDPGQVMTDLRQFARQRSGAFLALAAAAGVVAGRLTRGLTSDSGSSDSSSRRSGFSSTPTTTATSTYETGTDVSNVGGYSSAGGGVSGMAPAYGSGAAPAQETWTEGQSSDEAGNFSSGAAGSSDHGQPESTVYIDPNTGQAGR